jgi:hypothetical protein
MTGLVADGIPCRETGSRAQHRALAAQCYLHIRPGPAQPLEACLTRKALPRVSHRKTAAQSARRARQGAAKSKSRAITPISEPTAAECKRRLPTLPTRVRAGSRQTLRWLGTLVTLTLASVLAALLTGLLQHQGSPGHPHRGGASHSPAAARPAPTRKG